MPNPKEGESLPLWESRVVFQDTTVDGLLTVTVWRDDEPETELMRELGSMGTLRIYDSRTGELYHEERLALSAATLYGRGPSNEDMQRWLNILKAF